MKHQFETQGGKWRISDETLIGECGDTLRGYCLAGSELDTDYIVEGTVKLVSASKASVISNLTFEDDWSENNIECILDVANQKLAIALVINDVWVEIADRPFALALDTEYQVRVETITESDGSATLLFSVDGVLAFPVYYDLAAILTKGMFGFAVEGTAAANSTEFSGIRKYTLLGRYGKLSDTKSILDLSGTDEYNEILADRLLLADKVIDAELTKHEKTADSTNILIQKASAYYAAWLHRKEIDPAKDRFKAEAEECLKQYVASSSGSTVVFAQFEATE